MKARGRVAVGFSRVLLSGAEAASEMPYVDAIINAFKADLAAGRTTAVRNVSRTSPQSPNSKSTKAARWSAPAFTQHPSSDALEDLCSGLEGAQYPTLVQGERIPTDE